jgi:zinc-ribbon domain
VVGRGGGPAQAPAEAGAATGFCPGCGSDLEADSRFCSSCGRPSPLRPVEAAPAREAPSSRGGMPRWAWAAIGGIAIAAAAVAVVLAVFVFGGGGSERAAPVRAASPRPAYLARIRGPVDLLTRSATAAGNALTSAASADDVSRLRRIARGQLAAVSASYARLSAMSVAPARRADQRALLRAVGEQRRYLTVLVRTTGLAPTAALAGLGGVRAAGRRMVGAYRVVLRKQPGAGVGLITAAGLTQIDGLRTALLALREASAPPPAPQPAAGPPAPAPPDSSLLPNPAPPGPAPSSDGLVWDGG